MTVSGVMKMPKTGGAAARVGALNPPSRFLTCTASDEKHVYRVDGANLMQLEE